MSVKMLKKSVIQSYLLLKTMSQIPTYMFYGTIPSLVT